MSTSNFFDSYVRWLSVGRILFLSLQIWYQWRIYRELSCCNQLILRRPLEVILNLNGNCYCLISSSVVEGNFMVWSLPLFPFRVSTIAVFRITFFIYISPIAWITMKKRSYDLVSRDLWKLKDVFILSFALLVKVSTFEILIHFLVIDIVVLFTGSSKEFF